MKPIKNRRALNRNNIASSGISKTNDDLEATLDASIDEINAKKKAKSAKEKAEVNVMQNKDVRKNVLYYYALTRMRRT